MFESEICPLLIDSALIKRAKCTADVDKLERDIDSTFKAEFLEGAVVIHCHGYERMQEKPAKVKHFTRVLSRALLIHGERWRSQFHMSTGWDWNHSTIITLCFQHTSYMNTKKRTCKCMTRRPSQVISMHSGEHAFR